MIWNEKQDNISNRFFFFSFKRGCGTWSHWLLATPVWLSFSELPFLPCFSLWDICFRLFLVSVGNVYCSVPTASSVLSQFDTYWSSDWIDYGVLSETTWNLITKSETQDSWDVGRHQRNRNFCGVTRVRSSILLGSGHIAWFFWSQVFLHWKVRCRYPVFGLLNFWLNLLLTDEASLKAYLLLFLNIDGEIKPPKFKFSGLEQ